MSDRVFSITDIGTKRDYNQDAYTIQVARTCIGDMYMCVVCDGVGGLNKGEIASASVVTAFSDWFKNRLPDFLDNPSDLFNRVHTSWEILISELNAKLRAYGQQQNLHMGTTVSALFVAGDKALVLQVGDSRVYQYRQNKLCYRTKDQTLAQREFDAGNISYEQLLTDKRAHVLLQCVGSSARLSAEYSMVDCYKNDTFIVCSDGFYRHLSNDDMVMLSKADASRKTLQLLVNLVKSRKETDNITSVFMRV